MMKGVFQSFLLLLATATDRELAHQVQYLRAENRILRGKLPKRLTVTPPERTLLIHLGKPLGAAIRDVISIVSPRTFARWVSGASRRRPATAAARTARPGRPRTPEEIRALVLRLARENGWGYTRILGELKKLGIGKVSRSTVANLLRAEGLDPGPRRGEGTWHDCLRRHAATLWACDFFSKRVWTGSGLVDVFVLFFIHVGSRRVYVAGVTAHPDARWVAQQARNLVLHCAAQSQRPAVLLRDRDSKFVPAFDEVLRAEGVEVKAVGPRAPNLNAYAERWVGSVKRECLDHFVVFGEEHLRYLVTEYVAWYNERRPHQGKDNRPLSLVSPAEPVGGFAAGDVACEERLGGVLKHYYRRAAA
jgi:putative transposase